MPRKSPSKDVNQWASALVELTQNRDEPAKNPAAVALGRLGGLKGGKARTAALSPKERTESARNAARARWSKKQEKDLLAAVQKGKSAKEVSEKLGIKITPSEMRKKIKRMTAKQPAL